MNSLRLRGGSATTTATLAMKRTSMRRSLPAAAALGGLDPAAGDAVRDDAQEQFPLAGGPGLDARLRGGLALALALHVVRGPLDQHAPALASRLVDLVDLERHQVVPACDAGLQVLVECAVPGGPEDDRAVVPLVVHRQHGRAEPAGVRDAADAARRDQPQALDLVKLFDHAVSHGSTLASWAGAVTFNPDGMDLRPCRQPARLTRLVVEVSEPRRQSCEPSSTTVPVRRPGKK